MQLAKQIFRDEAVMKFGGSMAKFDSKNGKDSPEDIQTEVDEIDFIDEVEETGLKPSHPSTMLLRAASPMNLLISK